MKAACWIGVVVFAIILCAWAGGPGSGLRAEPEAANPPKIVGGGGAGGGPRVGETCTVYLRGDATGAAFHDRIPDLGNLISLHGAVVDVNATWLQLRDGDKVYRVPQASILIVESDGRSKAK